MVSLSLLPEALPVMKVMSVSAIFRLRCLSLSDYSFDVKIDDVGISSQSLFINLIYLSLVA